MAESIASICNEFCSNYRVDPQQFRYHIEVAFDKAKKYESISDVTYGVNELFLHILEKGTTPGKCSWTIDQVKIMIGLGANPTDMIAHLGRFVSMRRVIWHDF